MSHTLVWPVAALAVTRGANQLREAQFAGRSCKAIHCGACFELVYSLNARGEPVMSGTQFTDEGGRLLHEGLHPSCHIHYRDRGQDLLDTYNLTVYLDLPASRGGSDLKFEPEKDLY